MVYYLRLHFFEFWLCNSASPCLLAQFASNKPQQHYLWSTQDNAINLTTLKHGQCGSGSIPCIYWHWIPNLSVEVVMGTIATLPTEVANESWHTHTQNFTPDIKVTHISAAGALPPMGILRPKRWFLHLETFCIWKLSHEPRGISAPLVKSSASSCAGENNPWPTMSTCLWESNPWPGVSSCLWDSPLWKDVSLCLREQRVWKDLSSCVGESNPWLEQSESPDGIEAPEEEVASFSEMKTRFWILRWSGQQKDGPNYSRAGFMW